MGVVNANRKIYRTGFPRNHLFTTVVARADLNSLYGFQRTYKMANSMLGGEVAEDYRKIMRE